MRSFDIKAYDQSLGQFVDLGWGDDLRFTSSVQNPVTGAKVFDQNAGLTRDGNNTLPYAYGNFDFFAATFSTPARLFTNNYYWDVLNQTMAHEGRIPPLVADNRLDAQFPNPNYVDIANYTAQYSGFPSYSSNIGDDSPSTIRLRRVWDTWSTDYSRARAIGADPATGFPIGPPFSPPVYPSYPPPYPAPLRAIQIQVRVVDPSGQRIKSLTIRQDFTDKL